MTLLKLWSLVPAVKDNYRHDRLEGRQLASPSAPNAKVQQVKGKLWRLLLCPPWSEG